MKKYVALDNLWKCETCFHYRGGECAPKVWCEHGESYRPAYDKLTIIEAEEVNHAEWVKNDGIYSCSNCNATCPYSISEDMIEYWACLRCPMCGAIMNA